MKHLETPFKIDGKSFKIRTLSAYIEEEVLDTEQTTRTISGNLIRDIMGINQLFVYEVEAYNTRQGRKEYKDFIEGVIQGYVGNRQYTVLYKGKEYTFEGYITNRDFEVLYKDGFINYKPIKLEIKPIKLLRVENKVDYLPQSNIGKTAPIVIDGESYKVYTDNLIYKEAEQDSDRTERTREGTINRDVIGLAFSIKINLLPYQGEKGQLNFNNLIDRHILGSYNNQQIIINYRGSTYSFKGYSTQKKVNYKIDYKTKRIDYTDIEVEFISVDLINKMR